MSPAPSNWVCTNSLRACHSGQGKYSLTLLQNYHYLHSTLKVLSFTKLCNCYDESKIQGIVSFATLRSNWNPQFVQAQVCHCHRQWEGEQPLKHPFRVPAELWPRSSPSPPRAPLLGPSLKPVTSRWSPGTRLWVSPSHGQEAVQSHCKSVQRVDPAEN